MQSATSIRITLAAAVLALLSSGCDNSSAPQSLQARAESNSSRTAATAPAPASAPVRGLPDFSALVQHVAPAVVNISAVREVPSAQVGDLPIPKDDPLYDFFKRFGVPEGKPQPMEGLGSGVIITASGYILTNAHLVSDASEVTVKLNDQREFKGKVVGSDEGSDIALLKIEASDLPTVKIGDSRAVKVGEWVAAIGSPFGLDNSVTAGIVSAKARSLPESNYVNFIQTDVAINPGNSGGPLLNLRGEVIGINSQIYSRTGGYMGLSFAIPIDVAMKVEKDLRDHGKVSRGRIGINIQAVDQALAKSFGLNEPGGAIVTAVQEGGPAAKAGLKPGDIILGFNGEKMKQPSDLPTRVAETKPGTKADLEVWRHGKRKTIKVTIAEEQQREVSSSRKKTAGKQSDAGLMVRPMKQHERELSEAKSGVIVEDAKGVAARAGIRPGDVIVRVNDEAVQSREELQAALAHSGDTVALLVERDNNRVYVPLQRG